MNFVHTPYLTDIPALPLPHLADSLRDFCRAVPEYRQRYLQQNYGTAFDGYSFPGQKDSLNQGPEDHLHSFVFSDFYSLDRYPPEFHTFIHEHWSSLCHQVQAVEQRILTELGLESIASQFTSNFGHMMSANYYPGLKHTDTGKDAVRLSAHPDVSLLTVFPQGLGKDFQYQDVDGQWRDAPETDRLTLFAGDLLQWLTEGEIPALNHRVKHSDSSGERFSFALFSLPMPAIILTSVSGNTITTEDWYRLHLSQWDD
jgi:2OG-Fe(II) oxygenase superfamily